jgi:hypothetical protein
MFIRNEIIVHLKHTMKVTRIYQQKCLMKNIHVLALVNCQHKTRYKAPNFNFVLVCTTVISEEVHIKKSYNNVTNYSEQDPISADWTEKTFNL